MQNLGDKNLWDRSYLKIVGQIIMEIWGTAGNNIQAFDIKFGLSDESNTWHPNPKVPS
jgi:hypothetical protein